jgi:LuxR family maltose regulon positive regulatory protein
MKLTLPPETLAMLQKQLEGWVAGLQLVALSLQQGLTKMDQVMVNGRHRFIADYLSQEIVAQLPEGTQQFLLQTSILDRFCASLCQAVTNQEETLALLAALERENLFLIPLDDRREWFRYHPLFADFLRQELKRRQPEALTTLHQRASHWYLAHDQPEPAFYHALAGGEAELVLQVLERYGQPMLMGGEFKNLKQWLDSLPQAWHITYPIIDLFQTGFLLFTGQLEAGLRQVEVVEQRLTTTKRDDTNSQLARVCAIRCSIACFQDDLTGAKTFADQAFQGLPDTDLFFRAIIYGSLGDTYRRHGRWQEAKDCYLAMLDFIHMPAFRLQSAHIFGALADLYLRQGKLKEAANYWRQALAVIQERANWGRLPLPLIGWVYIRLAELLYEWNELDKAWEHLSPGLERAELGGDVRAMIAGYLIAGRLKLSEGDTEAATAYLEQARPLVDDTHFAHWLSRFERLQLELWLAQDKLRTAVRWSDQMLQDRSPAERLQSEVAQLAVARVLIVRGDERSLAQAQTFLEQIQPTAAEEGRTGIQIEALALQAIADERRGKVAAALTHLEHALRLAEPEGYIRRFADLGLPLGHLLQEARSRNVMPDYIETLLAAFGGNITSRHARQPKLPEPLTDREVEILELLAAGLTNPEIAEKLVISAGTVKKHASNIYGKLGVSSRTEAVTRARELGLLD